MSEQFHFSIIYKNQELPCSVTLIRLKYTYQLQIQCNDHTLFFEPDESSSYRMTCMPWQDANELEKIDKDLLKLIQDTLEQSLLK